MPTVPKDTHVTHGAVPRPHQETSDFGTNIQRNMEENPNEFRHIGYMAMTYYPCKSTFDDRRFGRTFLRTRPLERQKLQTPRPLARQKTTKTPCSFMRSRQGPHQPSRMAGTVMEPALPEARFRMGPERTPSETLD